ncbi:hypothetical protein AJ78_04926 [Emergomyces pasteurianus Ep9510]|uniref:Uncharacterized protein n=1 Tax=Emergomyces pasteurianus Ep9510 TaxID=1447872 RepID=A0A1J9PDS1_9EURO|nr:hypothetical protein AJ78_04926 [Emergomyces pasteurianus Ep9510]
MDWVLLQHSKLATSALFSLPPERPTRFLEISGSALLLIDTCTFRGKKAAGNGNKKKTRNQKATGEEDDGERTRLFLHIVIQLDKIR